MTLPETISVAKDILLGIAGATTAIVAVLGLRRWRQELEGKANFEVARNLIRATYRLREAIKICRAPFYSIYEFPEDYKGGPIEPTAEKETRAWAHIYKNRWAPVWSALQDFDSNTLEAEALWGSAIRTKTDVIRSCVKELDMAIDAILRDKASGGGDFAGDKEYGEEMKQIAAGTSDDEKNELNQKIAKGIIGVEEELRRHLRRGL
jgi:hypothetical protein